MLEKNYDAGRKLTTYKPLSVDFIKSFPAYKSIPNICNSELVKITILEKIRYINFTFDKLLKLHNDMTCGKEDVIRNSLYIPNSNILDSKPMIGSEYKFVVEDIVHNMKTVLDLLVQLTFLMVIPEEQLIENIRIEVDKIGALKKLSNDDVVKQIMLVGSFDYLRDSTGFIEIINELENSYKHSHVHPESNSLFCVEYPTFVSFYVPYNDFKNKESKAIYHNHNGFHIVMGFHDNFERIIENQKIFLKNST